MYKYIPWILTLLLYFPILRELYGNRWETIDYTHAYYILPVSLWIAWRKRRELSSLTARADNSGTGIAALLPVLAALPIFIFGWRRDFLLLTSFSAIPLLWGMTAYLYGPAVTKALRFPLLYLAFMLPPPLGLLDRLTVPLRYGISQATEWLLHAAHYPITRSGLMLTMNGNEIFMGAPCSGLRSLVTMIALATGYVYFLKNGTFKKIILVCSALPLALFGNLLRVTTLCLITYYFGRETADGFLHYFSGGLIFLFMISGLMLLEHLLNRRPNPNQAV